MIEGWENRLLAAVDAAIAKGRSARSIGEAADLGPNFVSQLRKGERTPRLNSLIKLAAELDVSLRYILFGEAVSREDEEILVILQSLSERSRQGFLEMLQGMLPSEDAKAQSSAAQEKAAPASRRSR